MPRQNVVIFQIMVATKKIIIVTSEAVGCERLDAQTQQDRPWPFLPAASTPICVEKTLVVISSTDQ